MTDLDFDAFVAWIAENDESAEMDWRKIEHLVTVCMVSELFGESNKYVAQRIIAHRRKLAA